MSARVTMKDIAAELGVSINTVHKALTGKAGVSESVRAKVNAKAEAMGYHRNTSASSLRRKDINLVFACLAHRARSAFSVTCGRLQSLLNRRSSIGALRLSALNLAGGYADALEQIDERLQVGRRLMATYAGRRSCD
ncbi:MAG: LacI family DNA-binding transcriptional regulator [Collinsella sp.]